jgi:hypothetical protein
MPITIVVSFVCLSGKECLHTHRVIQGTDDEKYQVLTIPQLRQVIKCGEDLVLFEDSKDYQNKLATYDVDAHSIPSLVRLRVPSSSM